MRRPCSSLECFLFYPLQRRSFFASVAATCSSDDPTAAMTLRSQQRWTLRLLQRWTQMPAPGILTMRCGCRSTPAVPSIIFIIRLSPPPSVSATYFQPAHIASVHAQLDAHCFSAHCFSARTLSAERSCSNLVFSQRQSSSRRSNAASAPSLKMTCRLHAQACQQPPRL